MKACMNTVEAENDKGNAGFTLLELMVSVAVFAIVTLSIGLALFRSDATDRHAQNWTVAYRAAQKEIELWLSKDFGDLVTAQGIAGADGIVEEFTVFTAPPVEDCPLIIEDISASWGGAADSAYLVTARVESEELQLDVTLSTVRTRY